MSYLYPSLAVPLLEQGASKPWPLVAKETGQTERTHTKHGKKINRLPQDQIRKQMYGRDRREHSNAEPTHR